MLKRPAPGRPRGQGLCLAGGGVSRGAVQRQRRRGRRNLEFQAKAT